ncbi:MAG: hypothetical protein Q3971_04790 [Moraxella sp.]|nr:hypothetical protein [Moraxella sp.]
MGFIGYLILGSLVYIIGTFIHQKHLKPQRQAGVTHTLRHPTIIKLLVGCFLVMLVVSAILGKFVMGHDGIDVAFVGVNSLVATFIFYFAINPDPSMSLPD